MTELYGRWWNRKWGRRTRLDIWYERADDGRIQVRWSGWDWLDRDGRCYPLNEWSALAAVEKLIRAAGGPEEDGGPWRELPLALYQR